MKDRRDPPELAAQVRTLILVRLLVMTVLGLLMWWADRAGSLGVSPGPPLGILAGIWALTLLYWMGLRFGVSLGALVAGQIALDLVIETILVAGTNGTSSPLVILYFLPIFSAGMFLYRRGALLAAGGAILAFSGVAAVVGAGTGEPLSHARTMYEIGIHAGAFLLLALLSGILAERSRRSRERLDSAQEELRRITDFTDRVLESMPIGLLTVSSDGRIVRTNRASREILGVPSGASLGGGEVADFLASLSPELGDALESVLVTRKWAAREEILVKDGAQERPIGVTVTPLFRDEEVFEGAIVTLTDLKDIRRMEREMHRAEQLANLGELATGVAHEIRNPLASISGAVQVLRAEVDGGGEEAELMDLIVRESDRLNRIIDGVLDYTRDHSSSRDVHDLAATAREVARLLLHDQRLSFGKTIVLEFPGDQDFRAEVEEGGMKQVFFNLARNAMEAMGMGGILRITGETARDGRVHLVFRDTGVGIEPHELEHIFKPFHTSKTGGTGMGLSIASRIVEGHGGTIRAKSTPGVGTAITVELPGCASRGGSSREGSRPKKRKDHVIRQTADTRN